VLPSEFTTLKKGGPQNGFITECVAYQTGASFAANDGQPCLRTSFRQQIPGLTGTPGAPHFNQTSTLKGGRES
jgi:hypothetical protein